ncbi:hypothetical protein GLOIN_2v1768952 [Rhizophagus irregularis DAOM 181602=DAOM 197198]|nr:hypothetical protein GLOIN_2v1768952 [Rhizophagus irregularis DAOM 181602=DAOM 197198]
MLYRKLIHYSIFIILSQLFNIIIVYGQEYIPGSRIKHTAVFVKPELKIYYIGGNNPDNLKQNPESDIFYLDIINTTKNFFSSWVNLKSQGVKLPHTFSHTANIGGANQDSVYIIGGAHWNENNTNFLYRFDTKTNELSVPVIEGKAPQSRIEMNSVSNEGKIYIFGGRTYTLNESVSIYVNQFDILDTINLNWQVGSLVNSPVALSGYTATLVNGIIYYIGGRSQQYVFSPMTEIFTYDIIGNKWSLKKATTADIETMPGSRTGHSAVSFDGKIFVYGGSYFNGDTSYDMPAKKTFVMLDTVNLVWSIPPLNDTNVPELAYHTATLLADTSAMILTFGNLMSVPIKSDNLIYLFYLDDPNFRWYKITPPPILLPKPSDTSSTPTSTETSSPDKLVIVSVSVGLVAVVLTICVVYYRYKKGKS